MLHLTFESFLSGQETDEHGKRITYRDDYGYLISVDSWTDPTYIALWYEGKKVGYLSLQTLSFKGETYRRVSSIEIGVKKHRGKGFGKKLYEAALRHMSQQYAGILSYLPDRSNRKQVPRIYSALNGYVVDSDYAIIPRPQTEK